MKSLPLLIRAIQQLKPYRRADHIPSLLASYSGDDWYELNRHEYPVQPLFETDEYRLSFYGVMAGSTPIVPLHDSRRYLIRVLHGHVQLHTPGLHQEYLYPSTVVKEYFTKSRSQFRFPVTCALLVYSEKLRN